MTIEDYQKIFHEIKNNITFISSSLQLVEKEHPEIKIFPYWNDSMREVRSLKNMLIELSSARLCNDLNLKKLSPERFFPDKIHSCMSPFGSSAFSCRIELEPSMPEIFIDPDRLKRAVFNLIKNSYEAMNGSGVILFTGCCETSFLRFSLVDYGGGIPEEYLPKLFMPLETTKPGGTGLGLLISRQIIESHGGRLAIDSRPQDGCTFSIYLPCT